MSLLFQLANFAEKRDFHKKHAATDKNRQEGLKGYHLFLEKIPSHVSIPPYKNGTMAKDAW